MKKNIRQKVFALCGVSVWLGLSSALLASQAPPSQCVTLGWTASPDPTVVGYYVYYGTGTGLFGAKVDAGLNTLCTLCGLIPGTTNYFETTSYNLFGIESVPTSQVAYVVPGILTVVGSSSNHAAFNLQFAVGPTGTYQLQASSDLKSWSNIWTYASQGTNGWVQYSDPFTNTVKTRYYRLVMP